MKTTVYSWRLTLERKSALEELARKRKQSVAELIDEAVGQWIAHEAANDDEGDAAQAALHRAAAKAIGSIAGGDPSRAGQAAARVREKLRQRRRSRR